MKRNILYICAALVSGLVVASCSVAEQPGADLGSGSLKFTASIGTYATKATDTGFEKGDRIGINANYPAMLADGAGNAHNVGATFDGAAFVTDSPIGWASGWDDPDYWTTFVAMYPYNENYSPVESFTFSVNADQSTHELYTASDLMFSTIRVAPSDREAHFAFTHALSQVLIKVDNATEKAIKNVFLGDVVGHATINNTYVTDYNYGLLGTIKTCPVSLSDGTSAWVAVVPPQDGEVSIVVEMTDGSKYLYTSSVWFRKGYRINAFVRVDDDSKSTEFESHADEWTEDNELAFGDLPLPRGLDWYISGNMEGRNWENDIKMFRISGTEYVGVFYNYVEEESGWAQFYIYSGDGNYELYADESYQNDYGTIDAYNYYTAKTSGNCWSFSYEEYLYVYLNTEDRSVYAEYPGYVFSEIGSESGWCEDHFLSPAVERDEDGNPHLVFRSMLAFDVDCPEFKIRTQRGWNCNFGSVDDEVMEPATTYSVVQDGWNFRLPSSGRWQITFDANGGTISVRKRSDYQVVWSSNEASPDSYWAVNEIYIDDSWINESVEADEDGVFTIVQSDDTGLDDGWWNTYWRRMLFVQTDYPLQPDHYYRFSADVQTESDFVLALSWDFDFVYNETGGNSLHLIYEDLCYNYEGESNFWFNFCYGNCPVGETIKFSNMVLEEATLE